MRTSTSIIYKIYKTQNNPQKLRCRKFLYSIQNSMERNENHHKCFTLLTSQTLHLFSHILWQMEKWLPLLCTQHSRGTPQGDLPLITASRWKRGGDKTSVKYRRYSNSKILFIKYFLE